MHFYCTNCWNEIETSVHICPYCGTNQNQLSNDLYSKKLIRALNHPEPGTIIRAANILADLKIKDALPALKTLLKTSSDPFILTAAIKAICKIAGRKYLPEINNILKEKKSFIIDNVLKELENN